MKKCSLLKKSFITILPISLGLGVFLGISKNTSVEEVKGYSTSSLPTTIDLKDTSASNIRSYYSSLNNLTTLERQGTNLLKNLKTILKNGQKYYSYDSGNAIWQMYEITDRDWEKSPETDISGYNSTTRTISGYTYGTSTSSKGTNPYLHALYFNRNVENQVRAWDDHQQTQWGINREHVWAKAEGFDTGGSGGARGDAMHLMAGNGYANNKHSNYFFGYVNTSSSYTDCGSTYSNLSNNLLGKSKTLGGTTNVFEPQDCDKGDIARAIFYMVARYNYYSGSDSDGIDGANPNLALSQSLSDWSNSGFTSSTTTKGYMGVMTDLLAWHHADPVDEFEIHRNNLLYTNFTNNRNPFIDFPEWADFIWGSVNYNGSTYISHSTTPTGYATPSSDTINGYNSGGGGQQTISVTGVSLNTNSISIEEGQSETLTATVAPNNATDQNVTWSTSNSSIATVSDGVVTGVSQGSATISVTTNDGGFSASCSVTVTKSSTATDETQFSLITSTSDLEVGKSYIITGGTGDSVVALGTTTNANNRRGVNASVENNKITRGSSIMSLTLGGQQGAWTFFTQNYTGTNGYLTPGDATNARLFVNASNDAYGLYTISFDNEAAVITSTGKNTYNIIRYNANGGSPLFSCYSSGQAAIYLWKEVDDSQQPLTSISASVSKTYKVGDRISKSDVIVSGDNGQTITDFTFANNNYQFSYSDAASGGALTSKTFNNAISYDDLSCSLTVQVSREAYIAPENIEISLTSSSVFNEIGGSNKSLVSGSVTYDDVVYQYSKAYYYSGGSALSFGNATNQEGFLTNTTPLYGGITNVTISSTGRDVNIRYSVDGSNWVLKASADVNNNIYKYFKLDCVGISDSSYSNITQINISANGEENAKSVSNYVMFADTTGQCTEKFDIAEKRFNTMSASERTAFMTSDDYVITTARTRFVAWANHFGKAIVQTGGDYIVQNSNNSLLTGAVQNTNDGTMVIICVCTIVSLTSLTTLLIIKKRKNRRA